MSKTRATRAPLGLGAQEALHKVVTEEATQEYEAAKRQAAQEKKKRFEANSLEDDLLSDAKIGLLRKAVEQWCCSPFCEGSFHHVSEAVWSWLDRRRKEEKRSSQTPLPLATKMMRTSESRTELHSRQSFIDTAPPSG